jgi:hypothetical protein
MRGPSGPTLTRQGRKRDVAACLPPRRCVAAYCHAVQSAHQAWAPIGCGAAYEHHACAHQAGRAECAHAVATCASHVLCDVLCDLTLQR